MLLKQLLVLAARQPAPPPAMYQKRSIRYIVDLTSHGRFLGVVDTASKDMPSGVPRLAPHVKRSGKAVRPKLLADTGEYVFGIGKPDADSAFVARKREAFREMVERCAKTTANPLVASVETFLRTLDSEGIPIGAELDPSADLTFRVDGKLPIDQPSVLRFWADEFGSNAASESAAIMPCISCGDVRPVLQRHPLRIKGIRAGQTGGTDLISANEKAFESYGLDNSLIAPTCRDCAEGYANALNALLAGQDTHLHVAGVEYVFWTVEETGFTPGALFSEPDPEEVRQLIDAARRGRAGAVGLDATAFYALALGASGSRVAVLAWIDTSVAEAKRRLGRYFALQAIVDESGRPGPPLPAWRLANATVRERSNDTPASSVPNALFGLALGGEPLPLDVLFQAVRRNRAEQGVNRARAALIKMVLGSRGAWSSEGDEAMTELDGTNRAPAYLCGRLLAVLEAIQRQALNNPNATIVDRFYGSASSAPASVFGTLLHGAQAHLGKLRKEPRTQGAYGALQRRLEEVMEPLKTFPSTLTLQEQGLFALGFYHQRAADRRARQERVERNEQRSGTGEANGEATGA